MATHVVIGKGNLGMDLKLALTKAGHKVHVLTASEGFEWPESRPHLLSFNPEYIWIAAGAGSVGEVKADMTPAVKTHVIMPVEMVNSLPEGIKVGIFSTDYAADENDPDNTQKTNPRARSLYALTKIWMEEAVKMIRRPNTTVFRVCSLYGHHFPERGFPGKLKSRHPDPCELLLPQNWCVPTPTWWVAETIEAYIGKCFDPTRTLVHHVAPSHGCTVIQWGQKILGEGYKVGSRGFDLERPPHSKLGCSLFRPPTWEDLWLQHQNRSSMGAPGDEGTLPGLTDGQSESP